jgi:IrrE N-terminal-like domain
VTNIVANLRRLTPHRALTVAEGLRVAELQATRLLQAQGITAPPVPEGVIGTLPRVQIERAGWMQDSGCVGWSKGKWVIVLNRSEPLVRQRFSLAHEAKHILDAPFGDLLYPAWRGLSASDRAEQVADHFAACLLMPKLWIRRAFCGEGITEPSRLAACFHVSQAAVRVRLGTLGMLEGVTRCGVRKPLLSAHVPFPPREEVA